MSFLAIIGAAQGRGPFTGGSSVENALAVQLFLVFVAVLLLFLAAAARERDDTERALRESEDRYRAVVDSQTDLLCRYLPDTTLTFVNAAYCRFFGQAASQLIGRKFIDFVPEGAREAVRTDAGAPGAPAFSTRGGCRPGRAAVGRSGTASGSR